MRSRMKAGIGRKTTLLITVFAIFILIDRACDWAAEAIVGQQALDRAYDEQIRLLYGSNRSIGMISPQAFEDVRALHDGERFPISVTAWSIEYLLSMTSKLRAATIHADIWSLIRLALVFFIIVIGMKARARSVVTVTRRWMKRRRTKPWDDFI